MSSLSNKTARKDNLASYQRARTSELALNRKQTSSEAQLSPKIINLPVEARHPTNLIWKITHQESVKGQLQRFHKLISNDRIWPSEHGFEVIFEKSLFVFEISASKVRNKRGIHSRFHSFSENNNREILVCDVTSDQSSMISTERSDLRDRKASGNCYV